MSTARETSQLFNKSNHYMYTFLLHDICMRCREIYALTDQPVESINAFLIKFKQNQRKMNPVLFHFVYALACDYFIHVTGNTVLLDEAKTAYINALSAFQVKEDADEFAVIQAYYKNVMETMNNKYKKKLFDFLSEEVGPQSFGKIHPSVDVLQSAFLELKDNLYLFDGHIKRCAEKLLNIALSRPVKELSPEDWGKISNTAFELVVIIGAVDDYASIDNLANQLSKLKLDNKAQQDESEKPMGNLWLIRDLLTSNQVGKFVYGIMNTLPAPDLDMQSAKRSFDYDADSESGNRSDPMVVFERRIVRAKRRMQQDEGNIIDVEMNDQAEQLDESAAEQGAKRFKASQ